MKRIVIAAAFLLAGCEVGPDYVKPDIATPQNYQELPNTKAQAPFSRPVSNEVDLSAWWMQFGDAELQRLIDEDSLRGNSGK